MTTENVAGTDSQPPRGARFYRCALQVNPHHYAQTYRGEVIPGDALSHAQAIVDKAVELGIEVLAITDHNNVNGVADFRSAARKRRRRLSAVCLGRTAAAGSGRVRASPAGAAEIARGRGGVHASSPPNRAVASAEAELLMRIEELELSPKTAIRLNTAPEGELPDWQPLEDLSTGQKARRSPALAPRVRRPADRGPAGGRPRQPLHHRGHRAAHARGEAAQAVHLFDPQREHSCTRRRRVDHRVVSRRGGSRRTGASSWRRFSRAAARRSRDVGESTVSE